MKDYVNIYDHVKLTKILDIQNFIWMGTLLQRVHDITWFLAEHKNMESRGWITRDVLYDGTNLSFKWNSPQHEEIKDKHDWTHTCTVAAHQHDITHLGWRGALKRELESCYETLADRGIEFVDEKREQGADFRQMKPSDLYPSIAEFRVRGECCPYCCCRETERE